MIIFITMRGGVLEKRLITVFVIFSLFTRSFFPFEYWNHPFDVLLLPPLKMALGNVHAVEDIFLRIACTKS